MGVSRPPTTPASQAHLAQRVAGTIALACMANPSCIPVPVVVGCSGFCGTEGAKAMGRVMEFLQTISRVLLWPAVIIQMILAFLLIVIIASQTTKSEQSGAGMGWGTIGGRASSSMEMFSSEAQLTRWTTIIAISFFAISVLTAVFYAWGGH
jgi:protein translocase SecG subunit